MKKFLVIYGAPAAAREQMMKAPPDAAKAGMELWMKWSQKAKPSIVDPGGPVGSAARVANGKASDFASEIGGYGIMQAESREALVALFDNHPHYKMPGGTIEVYELVKLPGM